MWLLVIVLLAAPTGISRMTVLNTFASYEDCQPERDRVGFAMEESYPGDHTFRIECKLQEQKPSHQPTPHEQVTKYPINLMTNSVPTSFSPLVSTHRVD